MPPSTWPLFDALALMWSLAERNNASQYYNVEKHLDIIKIQGDMDDNEHNHRINNSRTVVVVGPTVHTLAYSRRLYIVMLPLLSDWTVAQNDGYFKAAIVWDCPDEVDTRYRCYQSLTLTRAPQDHHAFTKLRG